MEKSFIDFKHSLEVLKKINSTRLDGEPLINSFFIGPYNIWHTFQARLFVLIQEHDFEKEDAVLHASSRSEMRWFLAGMTAVCTSAWAFLVLIVGRKKVLLYSVDKAHSRFGSDTRLDHLYEALRRNNEPFMECFHTTLGRDFRHNIAKRKRLALYLESFDFIYELLTKLHLVRPSHGIARERLDLSDFKDERERAFAMALIEAFVCRVDTFKFQTALLSRLLRLTAVTHLVGIDDPRAYFELLLACKENAIKSFVFQHGSITKYHIGWLRAEGATGLVIKPDTLFVWSDFWKQELVRLGTYYAENEIAVSGSTLPIEGGQGEFVAHKGISILIPYERAASKGEVKQYIEKFIACGAKVFFKARPGADHASQLREYSLENNNWGERFIAIDSLDNTLDKIDFIAGTYSTLLYDMVAHKKLVILMNTSSDYGEGLLANDLVESLDMQDNVCDKLHSFLEVPRATLEERSKRLFESGGKSMRETLDSLLGEIRKRHIS